jgi:hypothetical protein
MNLNQARGETDEGTGEGGETEPQLDQRKDGIVTSL